MFTPARSHPCWPVLVCLGCLVPFVGKAFHMDAPLFLYAARHIQEHPADFYGFTVNWYGTDMPMSEVMQNPPLAAYHTAIVARLFGWTEPVLHIAFLLPAVLAIWGTYRLAGIFSQRPGIATFAVLLTPAFLVCS